MLMVEQQLSIKARLIAFFWHLVLSVVVAALCGFAVFGLWYPFPYNEISGGRELFFLVVAVDVVCGPLLTAVLFNPAKPRSELWRDLSLVALIQLGALGYGFYTVWLARPVFLVMEIDRFKVVSAPDFQDSGVDGTKEAFSGISAALKPRWWSGPAVVAIRMPVDEKERQMVMFESLQGGADYALRPNFYLPYEGEAAKKSLARARPLAVFLEKQPSQKDAAAAMAAVKKVTISQWMYVPVVGRKDWIAILNNQGGIEGFLPGDGF